jgi:hypothetical protein
MSNWAPTIELNDGVHSAFMIPGRPKVHLIHLDAEDVDAEEGFMLVDLSNTADWPHTNTGHVHLAGVDAMFNPDPTFTGDIELGFLANVGDANGDLYIIHCWHFEMDKVTMVDHLDWAWMQFNCQADQWFGPIVLNSTLFQTDFLLQAPDGVLDAPSGDGDLALRVTRTAGAIDIGMTVHYEAHA